MNIMEEKLRAAEKTSGKKLFNDDAPASPQPPKSPSAPRGNGYPAGNRGGYAQASPAPAAPTGMEARPLPQDYVDAAEKLWSTFPTRSITTSKLRNILSLLTDIYNEESIRTESELTSASLNRIQMARVRMVYESGRDFGVKNFIEKSGLISYLKDIGTSRVKALNYIHYMEALVAYHRYFGGRN